MNTQILHDGTNRKIITQDIKKFSSKKRLYETSIFTRIKSLPTFIRNTVLFILHNLISPWLKLMRNVFLCVSLSSLSRSPFHP